MSVPDPKRDCQKHGLLRSRCWRCTDDAERDQLRIQLAQANAELAACAQSKSEDVIAELARENEELRRGIELLKEMPEEERRLFVAESEVIQALRAKVERLTRWKDAFEEQRGLDIMTERQRCAEVVREALYALPFSEGWLRISKVSIEEAVRRILEGK